MPHMVTGPNPQFKSSGVLVETVGHNTSSTLRMIVSSALQLWVVDRILASIPYPSQRVRCPIPV